MPERPYYERPLAAAALRSYRYKGKFGWIMIGALHDDEALGEAARSVEGPVTRAKLQRWERELATASHCGTS